MRGLPLRVMLAVSALTGGPAAPAQPTAPTLPAVVLGALQRAQLPPEALVAWVAEVGSAGGAPRLAHRPEQPVNPASLVKLYTTGAALELLGPAWTWTTPVLTTGSIDDGVLRGDLVIQGRGDPTLAIERVWGLLRQVQQRGIAEVRGDIVLDGSAFALAPHDPGEFDGERHRPYNVQPDALLLNLKSITLGFVPEPARGVARVTSDVTLAGVQVDASVPLAGGDCGDWRGALAADLSDPARLRLAGRYPAACGERQWPLAYAEPETYNARLVEATWRELGGRLGGRVRNADTPAAALPLFELASPPLAAVVRDINKFSNNVMAQQLFLTLALQAPPPRAMGCRGASMCAVRDDAARDTVAQARELLQTLVRERAACADGELAIDNGSGLSRSARSSARCLGAWLQALWASPAMPELMSSLPVTGIDGTARRPGRSWGAALGRAHLKTGSLRDAMGLAGYVLGVSGRRWAFVAIVNHPNAGAARPVLDALVEWTAEDGAQ
ncbi:MAG TPA: D-alanyl-D-alanine carboxypeptidase/D-alanyl-D-alanine-endopeptidase [Methylibium sp.]|nr:D-alanyl-D-alanine carboxypeptidase/D-alanyl-D-alanine-endopeptidase [Methylibium sp.]